MENSRRFHPKNPVFLVFPKVSIGFPVGFSMVFDSRTPLFSSLKRGPGLKRSPAGRPKRRKPPVAAEEENPWLTENPWVRPPAAAGGGFGELWWFGGSKPFLFFFSPGFLEVFKLTGSFLGTRDLQR